MGKLSNSIMTIMREKKEIDENSLSFCLDEVRRKLVGGESETTTKFGVSKCREVGTVRTKVSKQWLHFQNYSDSWKMFLNLKKCVMSS